MMRRTSGLTLGEILVISAVVLIVAAIAVPGLLSSRRASNERSASTHLKTIASAEADFRVNDRDGNGVNDFWTADVKGLYTMSRAAKPIELNVAAADGDGTFFAAGGENLPLAGFARPEPKSGYWFMSMLTDRSLGDAKEATYAQDTGGKPSMGAVHNLSKFAFTAFSDSHGEGGMAFIVNESGTVLRHTPRESVRGGTDVPPGRKGLNAVLQHWPDDETYRRICCLCGTCQCPLCVIPGEHDRE
jgi:type II secretory pathway pseudopilin PulG